MACFFVSHWVWFSFLNRPKSWPKSWPTGSHRRGGGSDGQDGGLIIGWRSTMAVWRTQRGDWGDLSDRASYRACRVIGPSAACGAEGFGSLLGAQGFWAIGGLFGLSSPTSEFSCSDWTEAFRPPILDARSWERALHGLDIRRGAPRVDPGRNLSPRRKGWLALSNVLRAVMAEPRRE